MMMERSEAGLRVLVRVTPKASKSGFAGVIEMPDGRQAVAVRIAAPPVDGAANAALIALLSKQLGVRKSDVAISSGETSRLKIVLVRGDGERIGRRLLEVLGVEGANGDHVPEWLSRSPPH